MEDIAPGLLEAIRRRFRELLAKNQTLQALGTKIREGRSGYKEAEEYAYLTGDALAEAFRTLLTPEALPEGRMFWNIAQRVVGPLLEEDHALIADAAVLVQKALNKKAGIGILAQRPEPDQDRIYGILNKLCGSEQFEAVRWVLEEPVRNFSISVVDETLRRNVIFQGRAGLRPRILRRATGSCCPWCRDLAGTYVYPDVPEDVYLRHENCRCVVEYDPGSGKQRQNVHTKRWTTAADRDTIEERKRYNLDNPGVFRPRELHNRISDYVSMDRSAVVAAAKAGKPHSHGGVCRDAEKKTVNQLKRSVVCRVAQVEHHAEKLHSPEKYVSDWADKDPREQAGLLKKWEKDMRRNAEQAEIELAVYEERFGI